MRQAIIGLLATGIAAGACAKAPPLQLTSRALDGAVQEFLRAKDAAHAAHLVTEERKFLEIGALRSPDERVAADVFLMRGITGVSIRALLEPRELLLAGMLARVPLATDSTVIDLGIGQRDILRIPAATLDEQADLAIGLVRYQFMQTDNPGEGARAATFDAQIAELRERATNPGYAAYRLEVIGTRSQLFTLLRDPSVRAVLVNRDSSVLKWLLADRLEFEEHASRSGPRN